MEGGNFPFGFGGDPEELMRGLREFAEAQAEHVERRDLPPCVQPPDDAAGVLEPRPGDVAGGQASDERPRNRRKQADDCAAEQRTHERSSRTPTARSAISDAFTGRARAR